MDALIIGGTRNLGPSIAARLIEAGFRVTVFHRGFTLAPLPPGVDRIVGNRSREEDLRRVAGSGSFDVVVDTTLYDGRDAEAVARVLDGRVGRYLMIGTGQVYLIRTGLERPFREDDYEGPVMTEPVSYSRDHEDWLYGAGKRAAEDALGQAWRERGFPSTVLRLPMVNSERDHHHRIHGYLARLLDGGPVVAPAGSVLDLRHVYGDDVARAVAVLARSGEGVGEAFNLSQDETLPLDEFLANLAAAAGTPLRIARVSRDVLEERGLLPRCSPFSGRWMSALDNGKSKERLGLSYTPVAAYLPRIVDRLRAEWTAPPGYERRSEELALAAE